MADVSFISVVDASKVRVRHVPEGASEVLFPILQAVVVSITGIFPAGWVGFSLVQNAVEIRVLFPVIKRITVGVVVAWVAGLGWVAVSTVDFNTIGDAITVGVRSGGVGEECQSFVRIVQAVTVRVGHLWIG